MSTRSLSIARYGCFRVCITRLLLCLKKIISLFFFLIRFTRDFLRRVNGVYRGVFFAKKKTNKTREPW